MQSHSSVHNSFSHNRSTISTASTLQKSLDTFNARSVSNPVIADVRNSMVNLQNEFKEKLGEKIPSNRVFKKFSYLFIDVKINKSFKW